MRLQEFVTVLVRDPKIQKEDSWHSYIDYEIFIHVCIKPKEKLVFIAFLYLGLLAFKI